MRDRLQTSPDARGREALLAWYAPRRTAYPWRRTRDPYAVLVSEVMLQQTQAARVVPAFRAFVRMFPSARSLALATRADVVRAWDGLGYNRRAVALSEAARAIVRDHGGLVPRDPASLRALPGVGPYTAAAVASVAFAEPVVAVDTNVRRIAARFHVGREPDDVAPAAIRRLAQAWLDASDPGAWNQALMDLGREVCRPRPRCDVCPLVRLCRFPAVALGSSPRRRRAEPFKGSSRQVRGVVVRVLRRHRSLALSTLAREAGCSVARAHDAVGRLERDGLVRAGPAALAGRPTGRVRLAD